LPDSSGELVSMLLDEDVAMGEGASLRTFRLLSSASDGIAATRRERKEVTRR